MNFKYPSKFIAKEDCGDVTPTAKEMLNSWFCKQKNNFSYEKKKKNHMNEILSYETVTWKFINISDKHSGFNWL